MLTKITKSILGDVLSCTELLRSYDQRGALIVYSYTNSTGHSEVVTQFIENILMLNYGGGCSALERGSEIFSSKYVGRDFIWSSLRFNFRLNKTIHTNLYQR